MEKPIIFSSLHFRNDNTRWHASSNFRIQYMCVCVHCTFGWCYSFLSSVHSFIFLLFFPHFLYCKKLSGVNFVRCVCVCLHHSRIERKKCCGEERKKKLNQALALFYIYAGRNVIIEFTLTPETDCVKYTYSVLTLSESISLSFVICHGCWKFLSRIFIFLFYDIYLLLRLNCVRFSIVSVRNVNDVCWNSTVS